LQIGTLDGSGAFTKLWAFEELSSAPVTYLHGPNNAWNVLLTHNSGNTDGGWVAVCDEAGLHEAGMYVDTSGDGVIYADTKNFRVDNPRDADTEIWYACIEGPEAATYSGSR